MRHPVSNGYNDIVELRLKSSGLALLSRGVAMQACGSGRSFCRHVEPHRQPLSELWRYDIDLAGRRVAGRRRLCDHVLEFPAINPLYQGMSLLCSLVHLIMCQQHSKQTAWLYCVQQHCAPALPAEGIAVPERFYGSFLWNLSALLPSILRAPSPAAHTLARCAAHKLPQYWHITGIFQHSVQCVTAREAAPLRVRGGRARAGRE